MTRIVLAYDGSIHADWVGRYAVRLAGASGSGLEVLHVDDGASMAGVVESRLAHLREIAAKSSVDVSLRQLALPPAGGVAGALHAAVPPDAGCIIVSGLRARESGRGLLRGTVSERLLRSGHHDVLAIRVVSPSLLGHARHVLLSLSENPDAARRAALFLRLFASDLASLSLLTVVSPRLGRLASPTGADLRSLRARGMQHLSQVESQLRGALAPFEIPFDAQVSVAWDWSTEVTQFAARTRPDLVLLGSTERTLASRFVFGNPLERALRDAVCDVAIFRRAQGARR